MRFKEIIIESPVILNQPKTDIPRNGCMSKSALEREYYKIGSENISPLGIIDLYLVNNKSHLAGIFNKDMDSEKQYVEQPFRLLLKKTPTIDVGSVFQNPLQVDWVAVDEKNRSMTVATRIYAAVAKSGYTMLSDNEQFPPGAALWLRIAKTYGVYVIDHDGLWSKNGIPVVYDGSNIPANKVWSKQPNFLKKDVVLILSPDRVK